MQRSHWFRLPFWHHLPSAMLTSVQLLFSPALSWCFTSQTWSGALSRHTSPISLCPGEDFPRRKISGKAGGASAKWKHSLESRQHLSDIRPILATGNLSQGDMLQGHLGGGNTADDSKPRSINQNDTHVGSVFSCTRADHACTSCKHPRERVAGPGLSYPHHHHKAFPFLHG